MIPVGILTAASGSNLDPDAVAFFARVTAAGGTLTNNEKTAVNTLTISLKSAGIWTLIKALYPMVGASAAACAQNLISSSFTGTYLGGWSFSSTGITPNGGNSAFNTNLNPNVELLQNSNHLSYYSRTSSGASTSVEIGSQNTSTPSYFYTHIYYTGNLIYNLLATSTATPATNTNSLGFFNGNRNSSTIVSNFKNGTNLGNSAMVSVALNSLNVYIGAVNSNGSPNSFSTKECAFATIGYGLSDALAANFYTAVQAFQTTLSRQV
jgi:hypothetical protein